MNCRSCGAELPDGAAYCVECGAAVSRPNTGATTVLPAPARTAQACQMCGADNPDEADYCVRCGARLARWVPTTAAPTPAPPVARPATPARRWQGRRGSPQWEGAIFLIGLGLIFLLKAPFWPTILVVIGLSAFVGAAWRGHTLDGLGRAIWLFGIAFLLTVPRLLWPGVLVLVGVSLLLDWAKRAVRHP